MGNYIVADFEIWVRRLNDFAGQVNATNKWINSCDATCFGAGESVFEVDARKFDLNQHIAVAELIDWHINNIACPARFGFADSESASRIWCVHLIFSFPFSC